MASVATTSEKAHTERADGGTNERLVAAGTFRRELWLFLLTASLLVGELFFLFFYRQVNLDEGWYLWASKLVYEGSVLYRDFAYTQTPLLPYVYGFFQHLLGDGLYQGRAVTLFFSLVAFAFSAATAYKLAGLKAACFCLALLAASVFALAQYSYTATYALTALFLSAGLYFAASDLPDNRRTFLAALCMAMAISVRLSVIAAFLPFFLYIMFISKRPLRAGLLALLVATLWLGGILGFFWLLAGEKMSYDILGFHTDRLLRTDWQMLRIRNMALRTREDFIVLMGLCTAGMLIGVAQCWRLLRSSWRNRISQESQNGALLIMIFGVSLALFLVHLLPRTTDSYYNALQTPMMAVAGGILLARWFSVEKSTRHRYLWFLVALVLATHAARQGLGFLRDQYVVLPVRNQIAITRDAADLLHVYTHPGDSLLSFSPHLALEADLQVPSGYEMAIFAYRPTWSDVEAQKYNVVNNKRLLQDLRQGVDVVALTTFDLEQLSDTREMVLHLLYEQYRWFATVPDIGPYRDDLHLYWTPQYGLPTPSTPQHVAFAENITLLGYDLSQSIEAGEPVLNVALYWRAIKTPSRSYTVFVQLLHPDGGLAVGWDNPPCRGTCPTSSWRDGEFVRDEYTLALTGLSPGVYQLQVGMYDPVTAQRLAVVDEIGQSTADHWLLTEVEIDGE